MNQRAIRKLPFPPASHFTLEMVRQIKAIPDEEISYSEQEIVWMELAIQNLEYMIACAKSLGIKTTEMDEHKALYEAVITKNNNLTASDRSR